MKEGLSVTFVLPMFNELDNIQNTIDELKALSAKITGEYEIVVVDDASTDGCGDIVKALAAKDSTIKIFRLEKNTKFGGAFARGFQEATKDVIVYMDSDMPVKEEDILASFALIRDADVVHGYSSIKKGDTFKRKVISRVYNLIVSSLFGLDIKDINSGYKIVRRSAVKDAVFISRSPFVDVELFLHVKRKNCKIQQFPLVFRSRAGGKSYIARLPVILATAVDMLKVKIKSLRKQ